MAVLIVGSVLTVAYSGRFVLGVLGRLGERRPRDHLARRRRRRPRWFVAPALLLASGSVVAGLAPVMMDATVRAATVALYTTATPKDVVLWAGFNTAFALSAVIIVAGIALVVLRRPIERLQTAFASTIERVPDNDRAFWGIVSGVSRFARRATQITQNGSLPIYLMVIFGVAATLPLAPAIGSLDVWPDVVGDWVHIPIAVLIVAASIGATVVRRRIAAALMLGAVGFAMAGFYVVQGAPDLALTQFAIETLATVLFVLVLRFLPRRFVGLGNRGDHPRSGWRSRDSSESSVFVLALVATGARSDVSQASISERDARPFGAGRQGIERRQRDPRRLPWSRHAGRDHGARGGRARRRHAGTLGSPAR